MLARNKLLLRRCFGAPFALCRPHRARSPLLLGRATSAAAGAFQRAAPRRNPRSGATARTSGTFPVGSLSVPCRFPVAPVTSRVGTYVGPPEAVPRCGSVGYDPGGSLVLPWPHVATVYVSQRVLCRFVVTRRSSSTVAPRRPLHHSPPPRARVVRVTRSFTPPRPPTTRASWNDVVRQPAVSNTPVAACGRESSPITRLCRQAPMMAKDMHPSHVLVWLLEPRECFFAAYICRT